MKRAEYYTQIICTLEHLHSYYPKYSFGKHLAMAIDGQGDLFTLSDRQILNALLSYSETISYGIHEDDDEDINNIIKEGMHLTTADLYNDIED